MRQQKVSVDCGLSVQFEDCGTLWVGVWRSLFGVEFLTEVQLCGVYDYILLFVIM